MRSLLTKDEEEILKSIKIGSYNNPSRPEFPPENPRFPATPTKKIEIPGFKQVFVKDEHVNPTGTHKDRMAWEIVCQYRNFLIAKKMGMVKAPLPQFSIISSGNAAIALAYFLEKYNLPRPKILIDNDTPLKILNYLKKIYCEIFVTDLSRKPLNFKEILELTENENGFDITSNEALDPHTIFYDWMSFEIINQVPDYILVPFGTGSLFENICNIIKEEMWKIDKNDPRLKVDINLLRGCNIIGATVNRPKSKAYMLYSPHLPFTQLNEQWLNFYKKFGYVGKESNIYIVGEEAIEEAFELLNSQGINCEHSGAAGLAYLLENKNYLPKDKKYLVINTGKGKWMN
jgi:threonine dehydratase